MVIVLILQGKHEDKVFETALDLYTSVSSYYYLNTMTIPLFTISTIYAVL